MLERHRKGKMKMVMTRKTTRRTRKMKTSRKTTKYKLDA